ncbi:MAG: UDP-N-acetylmuramoyl-tripeptide--D-alanyl-D-alanine ligase [Verrucomicrobiales bacterium]|nr:UDP-N-acetylmuramoyl-tripeptide--D-alanyl-D-alanine ligase [Verrucomicrobiales bacterium]
MKICAGIACDLDAVGWPLRARPRPGGLRRARRASRSSEEIVETREVSFVVAACEGELVRGDARARIERVCTDSRKVRPGDLFFALAGERFDGHDFVVEVARQGAAAVVVERGKLAGLAGALRGGGTAADLFARCAVIAVDHTRRALGRLAAAYRRDFSLPVVAVGGSNGKTTTKELIASVLSRRWNTLWSEASFNNDIGVPLTLLRLERAHQAAVLEVGTNHPGELAPLVRMAAPRYGVITNIGREHLEFFGDLAGVAAEQGALAELLPAEGALFLNGDSAWAEPIAARSRARVVRVGLGAQNDWRARAIRLEARAASGGADGAPGFGVVFEVDAPDRRFDGEYRVNLLGRHQALNALLAIAVGAELGLAPEEIRRGLLACGTPKMRLQLFEHRGVRVLDDAYNANADSMIAALETLMELPCEGRRIAVLGEMAELGAQSQAAHAEVGRRAAELGVGQVFAVGKMAAAIARAAREAGLVRVMEFEDAESATAVLKRFVKPGDVVLVKASRVARLERISEALRTNGNGKVS